MSIKKIVRSRTVNKKSLPPWYKKRVDTCKGCKYSFNRRGKKRTIRNWWMYILGVFKNTCTICNCPIKFKAALKDEFCSMEAIGKKPKWDIEK